MGRYNKKYRVIIRHYLKNTTKLKCTYKYSARFFFGRNIPFFKIYKQYLYQRMKLKKRAFSHIIINEKTNLLFWYQFKSKVFKSRQTKNLTHKYMKLTLRDSAGNTFDVQNLFRFMKKLKIHPITKQGLYESFVFQKSEVRSELIFLEKLFAGRVQLFDYQKVENFYFQGRCLNYVKPHYHPDKFNRYLNRLSVYFLSLHQLFYKEMKIKEKLLNKFRNSFSKIRILKQLKLNQNKL